MRHERVTGKTEDDGSLVVEEETFDKWTVFRVHMCDPIQMLLNILVLLGAGILVRDVVLSAFVGSDADFGGLDQDNRLSVYHFVTNGDATFVATVDGLPVLPMGNEMDVVLRFSALADKSHRNHNVVKITPRVVR